MNKKYLKEIKKLCAMVWSNEMTKEEYEKQVEVLKEKYL